MKTLSDNIKSIIAILVVVGSFSYFFVTYFVGKSQSDPQIIIAIVGAMTIVLNYFFGSSSGAAKKDDVIATIASNSQQQPLVTQTGSDPTVIQSSKK